MQDTKIYSPTLLDALYRLGEEMWLALNSDQIECFFELTNERGTLLDSLRQYENPAEVDPEWDRKAKALAEQYDKLSTALASQEQKMGETLGSFKRFARARSEYAQKPRSGRILNQNVCG